MCHGVRVLLIDRHVLDSPLLGLEIASALYRLYPTEFHLQEILGMVGSRKVLQAITEGQDPKIISSQWQDETQALTALKSRYLLY